jgi:hypothetical protein
MRKLLQVGIVLALALAVAGCGSSRTGGSGTGTSGGGSGGASGSGSVAEKPDPYAEMPLAGPNEKAAAAALPAAIADATERNKSMSKATVDVTKAKAVLYAYEVIATVGENTTLMEVRKDGKAYGLYAWGIEPDPAKTTWTSVSLTDPTQNVAPASDPEKAAVAACTELAGKLAPGKTADMKMAGYFFVFMGADGIPLKDSIGQDCMILVTPKGMLGQWTF